MPLPRFKYLGVLAPLLLAVVGTLARADSPAVVEPVENDAPLVLAARAHDVASVHSLLAARPRPPTMWRRRSC